MDESRLYHNLLDLCQVASVSATEGERAILALLGEKIAEIPYFKAFPAQTALHTEGKRGGLFVHALMKSPKPVSDTILLLSHFDVVGVEDCGTARSLAFSPRTYTRYLKANPGILSKEGKEDLLSGDYLFGRGICDMKWGIAAHLEILHHFSARLHELPANLLFLSVSDEERNSAGMLDALPFLLDLQKRKGLTYRACIVSEPPVGCSLPGDGALPLHVGAAGKLMPAFFCLGKETHAGEPFLGLNPHFLTAALVSFMETSPAFTDVHRSHSAPAPCCLKQGDLQSQYSVQIPGAAYAYFNKITLNSTPQAVLKAMEQAALDCFDQVLRERRKRFASLQEKGCQPPPFRDFAPRVLTYQKLCKTGARRHPKIFLEHMAAFAASLPKNDLQNNALLMVREACAFLEEKEPAIILFFCPPYYPHSLPLKNPPYLLSACARLVELAPRWGEHIATFPYFDGITDMCYLASPPQADLTCFGQNCPLWEKGYDLPGGRGPGLNIPFVNLGPRGKDAHQPGERLFLPHALKVAPHLLLELIFQLAKES